MMARYGLPARRAALVGAVLALSGCAQEGDFGRARRGGWNSVVETTGTIVADLREEPASTFPLTDDERILRDRAWRFLMPAASPDIFLDIVANLTRTRVLPPSWREPEIGSYGEALLAAEARSQVSRYRRLSEDATADGRLIPAFVATAQAVNGADALRLRSLPFVKTLGDEDVRNAAMRIAENRCLVAWVRAEMGVRVARYRAGLDQLVVAVPDPGALDAERAIVALDTRRGLLEPLLPPDAAAQCGFGSGPLRLPPPIKPLVLKG